MSLDFELYSVDEEGNEFTEFNFNITHNLTDMARACGIYECLWHPNENDFEFAGDCIRVLTQALENLKANPEYFSKFNAVNGWGMYEHFVPFVEKVLEICKEYPGLRVRADI